jgi:hypothetical protein
MENGPFIDGLPIKNGDFPWQTVSHNQKVYKSQIPNAGEVLRVGRENSGFV